jgi:DNA-binding MarR family transcriptional regulator
MAAKPDGEDAPPAPSRGKRTDFDRSVTYLVTALANKMSIAASRRLRPLKIGLMEWRVIALLGVEHEASPARVAQVAGVDKSVVSRAVTSLAKAGLIEVNAKGGPGRQTMAALTPSGWDLHEKGIVNAIAAEESLLHGFTAAEQDAAITLLKRLTANLGHAETSRG